jgi:hypothetical protein
MTGRKVAVFVLLFLFVCSSLVFLFRVKDKMVDFQVNYQAAKRLRLGETLYRVSDGHYQFKYMPFSAFLYLPLTFLPLSLAKGVWYVVILLCAGLIFFFSLKLLRLDKRRSLIIGLLSFVILARYFLRELQLGQINALITFFLLLMTWFLVREARLERTAAGPGIFWGLAAALKPYAVIFFPYFAIRKKGLTLASGALVLILALLAPSLFYGLDGNIRVLGEWQSSLRASTPSLFSSQDNISLIGLFMKWTGRQDLSLVLYFAALATLGLLVLLVLLRKENISEPVLLECFLLLALIPLISPLGWDYTLLSSAPAVMLILKHFDRYRRFWKAFLCLNFMVIALSLYDFLGRDLYASFMSCSVITINFLILIGYLAYLRIKGHA